MKQITVTLDITDNQWERLRKLREEMDGVDLFTDQSEAVMFAQVVHLASEAQIEERLAALENVMRRIIERKRREGRADVAEAERIG